MTKQHDTTRPKVTFQARFDADAFDKITRYADEMRRSKSELIDFAVQHLTEMDAEEISMLMLKSSKKARGKDKG